MGSETSNAGIYLRDAALLLTFLCAGAYGLFSNDAIRRLRAIHPDTWVALDQDDWEHSTQRRWQKASFFVTSSAIRALNDPTMLRLRRRMLVAACGFALGAIVFIVQLVSSELSRS